MKPLKEYRGYLITFSRKPIPVRFFDFDYAHEDYDGAPDSGDRRSGNAASICEAKNAIDELIDEERDGNLVNEIAKVSSQTAEE